jgi:hypothetical protein
MLLSKKIHLISLPLLLPLQEFSSKVSLSNHQRTVKSCLKLQGKDEVTIECCNCKKVLAIRSYKQHKIKCNIVEEEKNKNRQFRKNKIL